VTAGPGARLVRGAARAPVRLYRAGFGWLFGERLLMLRHTGRRTGRARFVVLEVVRRPSPTRYVVASGMGTTADWYRNVAQDPHVAVWVARRRDVPAIARPLPQSRAREHLQAYRAERPLTWRFLRPVLAWTIGRSADELVDAVPLVELELAG
jgi:deazaflavin-dependent oxidoreductase (nitroreductase family)